MIEIVIMLGGIKGKNKIKGKQIQLEGGILFYKKE